MSKHIFLDRDGVINEISPGQYINSVDDFRYIPRVKDALRALDDAGYQISVITNQSAIGRGYTTWEKVEAIHRRLIDETPVYPSVYVCPHTPDAKCGCRKPKPGLLLRAARETGADLAETWFVGDSLPDIQAAHGAGCRAMLVLTGYGNETLTALTGKNPPYLAGAFTVRADLSGAVDYILGNR